MNEQELLQIINGGESSTAQFKERLPHPDSLADEIEIFDTSIKDVETQLFSAYFKKEFEMDYEEKGLTLEEALVARKVMRNNHLTLAGLLFFGWEPQSFRPAFTLKFVMFVGNDIGGNNYKSKPEDLKGTIPELFKQGMMYVKSCIKYLPYSGLGSGLRRALANQPDMELINDVESEQFIVRFPRKE